MSVATGQPALQGLHPGGDGPGMDAGRGQVLRVGAGVDHAPHHEPDLGRQVMRAHLGFDTAETLGLDLRGETGLPGHVDSSLKQFLEGRAERRVVVSCQLSVTRKAAGNWLLITGNCSSPSPQVIFIRPAARHQVPGHFGVAAEVEVDVAGQDVVRA